MRMTGRNSQDLSCFVLFIKMKAYKSDVAERELFSPNTNKVQFTRASSYCRPALDCTEMFVLSGKKKQKTKTKTKTKLGQ